MTNLRMSAFVRRVLAAFALAWFLFGATPALAGKRVALIIANAHYEVLRPTLETPPADADLMQGALVRAGFTTTVLKDGKKGDMERVLQRFGHDADGAEIALVYYAGHGLEIAGRAYLLPIDAHIVQASDLDLSAIQLDTVRATAARAQLRLVIYDACRDDPLAEALRGSIRVRGGGGDGVSGLHGLSADEGEAVLYSTRAGTTAIDGATNSPFAAAFARWMTEPGLELDLMIRRVSAEVVRQTGQEPYQYSRLPEHPIYLVAAPAVVAAPRSPGLGAAQIEALVWQGVLAATTEDGFADYLRRYPSGTFAAQARANLRRLQAPAAIASAATPPIGDRVQTGVDALATAKRYFSGGGATQNDVQAAAWFRRAADAGNAEGMAGIGFMYDTGRGVPQDVSQAAQWYARAADAGSSDGMANIASMYDKGRGVPYDIDKAVHWYARAADAGSVKAMLGLANLFEIGRGVPKDWPRAFQWYRRAAEKENPEAMNYLGYMLDNGFGVEQDSVEAVRWYRAGALQSNVQAMRNLGLMYEFGRGVPQDYAQAAKWYRQGAMSGNVNAMVNLGVLYQFGKGVKQDDAEAASMFRGAAEGGDRNGMKRYAEALDQGLGVPRDPRAAAQWRARAAAP